MAVLDPSDSAGGIAGGITAVDTDSPEVGGLEGAAFGLTTFLDERGGAMGVLQCSIPWGSFSGAGDFCLGASFAEPNDQVRVAGDDDSSR